MKAKIRKTGEIVDVICFGGSPNRRSDALDYVNYIDSQGVEHTEPNHLNYYWDFEPIETATDKHWQDVRERAAIAAMQALIREIYDSNENYLLSELVAKNSVKYADTLIEELKKKITMATIKSYTDVNQSRKLCEILPLESADMAYWKKSYLPNDYAIMARHTKELQEGFESKGMEYIPCWSLAALIEEIPSTIVNNVGEDLKLHIDKDNLQYYLFYENEYTGDMFEIETESYDNMIDACVEMILKLHELNLL